MAGSGLATERYFLVGFMGAGKTTLGSEVAKRMDLPFHDLDDRIERSSGRTVAEIFSHEGEEGFRRRESRALRELVDEVEEAVVATGGGAFVVEENRRLMKESGIVVWIDVPLREIMGRIEAGSRPLWTTLPEAERLLLGRRSYYQEAHHHLVLENVGPGEAVERLHQLLAGSRRAS